MSATNRGSVRLVGDTYYTPDNVAQACVDVLANVVCDRILEPSVGGGAFVRAAREIWPRAHISGIDVDPNAPGFADCSDYSIADFGGLLPAFNGGPWDLIVGNPPYANAEAHVRHALAFKPKTCGFLLRLGFLEGLKRKAFWDEHPPSVVYVLRRRPSFTGGGTDASAYGFFVWEQDWAGPTVLTWLDT